MRPAPRVAARTQAARTAAPPPDEGALVKELGRKLKVTLERGLWDGLPDRLQALEVGLFYVRDQENAESMRSWVVQQSITLAGELEQAKARQEAIYVLENCFDMLEDREVGRLLGEFFKRHAVQLAEAGKRSEAAHFCNRWQNLDPENPQPRQLADRIAAGAPAPEAPPPPTSPPAGAEELLERLLQNPESAPLHALADELEPKARVALYTSLASQKASSPGALAGLARAYNAVGQTQKAVVHLQKALKMKKDPAFVRELAVCYDRLGKPALAEKLRAALRG